MIFNIIRKLFEESPSINLELDKNSNLSFVQNFSRHKNIIEKQLLNGLLLKKKREVLNENVYRIKKSNKAAEINPKLCEKSMQIGDVYFNYNEKFANLNFIEKSRLKQKPESRSSESCHELSLMNKSKRTIIKSIVSNKVILENDLICNNSFYGSPKISRILNFNPYANSYGTVNPNSTRNRNNESIKINKGSSQRSQRRSITRCKINSQKKTQQI